MSQSGFIAAMLLAAFIIWLAINDRLTAYSSVLFGPTQQPTPQGNISDQNGLIAPAATAPAGGGTGSGIPSLPDMSGSDGGSSGGGGFISDLGDIAGLLEFLP